MLGFLFLTYDDVFNENIWLQYFRNVNPNDYKLFVHPKYITHITNQSLFKNCIIPNRCETSWGSFSLIEAQKLLIEEALKTHQITHFILISYNSIPTTPFYYMHSYLENRGSMMGYGKSTNWDHLIRYNNIVDPIFSKDNFYIQSQWCILCRTDAEILVNEHETIKNIFRWMIVPDEHVYINYLIHYKHRPIEHRRIMHNEWENNSPKKFTYISNDHLWNIKNQGGFFLRKAENNINLDVNYLLS